MFAACSCMIQSENLQLHLPQPGTFQDLRSASNARQHQQGSHQQNAGCGPAHLVHTCWLSVLCAALACHCCLPKGVSLVSELPGSCPTFCLLGEGHVTSGSQARLRRQKPQQLSVAFAVKPAKALIAA